MKGLPSQVVVEDCSTHIAKTSMVNNIYPCLNPLKNFIETLTPNLHDWKSVYNHI
jgi:hypothetical protein